ncbi:RluA family pseudouridine synthase [Paenibacillaceae bacterium WGS1546]|uniref:RluA family pseudouridine synthase n=1 Tax=Cohnella sp. WGS1546 TaxID=3366810 RepID=UPI00372D167F
MSGAGRNRQRGGTNKGGGPEKYGRGDSRKAGNGGYGGKRRGEPFKKPDGIKGGRRNEREPAADRGRGDRRAPDGASFAGRKGFEAEAAGRSDRRAGPSSRPGGKASEAAGAHPAPWLGAGRVKGEWMDIRLPAQLAGAPMSVVGPYLPLPPKLIAKLMRNRGCLLQGANLRLHLFPRETRDYPSDWMELNILYEDEFTLVVHKPAGIEVHPSEKGQRKTLAHAVAAYYEATGQDLRVRHVHRIDKDTTGPVLYAKNEFAQYRYDKGMREKSIGRVYLALVEGVVENGKGKIDLPIGQDRHHSTRRRVSETGDPAVTHYEVAERFADHTLVRLHLETGRTHQIRVHMSAIGHPLAGDGLYGGKRGIIARQALHGERLVWHHPWTGEKLRVAAPLPDDFRQALDELRRELGKDQ